MSDILNIPLDARLQVGVAAFTFIVLGYATFKMFEYSVQSKRHIVYPPGPPREFLIGTLRSFPKDHFWNRWCQWAAAYGAYEGVYPKLIYLTNAFIGEIVYAPLPGMDIVVLNSHEIAQELLGKRPSSTSGRQAGYFLHTMSVKYHPSYNHLTYSLTLV
jgi:hypothetical protein